jgi:hypothetical protein
MALLFESACSAGGARLILPSPWTEERRPEGNTANERLLRLGSTMIWSTPSPVDVRGIFHFRTACERL